jgi:nucleoid-associated protein YgaU
MNFSKLIKKYFKSTEEVVSMFLGLVIVVVVTGMIFNFIQKRKGSVTIPGVSDITITSKDFINKENDIITESSYVVVAKDSLWKIAMNKYNNGFIWTEIAKSNNLKNPNSIEVGQKLVLPKIDKNEIVMGGNNQETIITTGEYKVVKNDSLWKIALRAYGDGYQWTKIWQENKSKLIDPNKLEIGMMLVVPSLK